jgi:23S rRNA (guanine2445-N2)-methyltransferase / 23S rRNA (guanine2069-N7)-methyltransferase
MRTRPAVYSSEQPVYTLKGGVETLQFFATTARNIEDLAAAELTRFGADEVKENPGGVFFTADLETAYRSCLWTRICSRILLTLTTFDAGSEREIYAAAREIDWSRHLDAGNTFRVDYTTSGSAPWSPRYAALLVKDALADFFTDDRSSAGKRPDVVKERPDIRLSVHSAGSQVTIALDLSGESLHARGYRLEAGAAPLRETVAAALLMRAKWPEAAAEGLPFLDPMCGSGTLPIEAAMIAGDIAPGLLRTYFGFLGWRGHRIETWQRLLEEAVRRRSEGLRRIPDIEGRDSDAVSIAAAEENAGRAGVAGKVVFKDARIQDGSGSGGLGMTGGTGLVCTNPPYGVRMGRDTDGIYRTLGEYLKQGFPGWKASVLAPDRETLHRMGMRADSTNTLYNGSIKILIGHFSIYDHTGTRRADSDRTDTDQTDTDRASPGAQMFANRIAKNLKRLGKQARRDGVTCYRLYDADMPEYAVAVDRYLGVDNQIRLCVQEYAPPRSVDTEAAERRLREILSVLPEACGVAPDSMELKTRRRQRGPDQYGKQAAGASTSFLIEESGLRFAVDMRSYLDTGIFLDHRITRRMLRNAAAGKRFLNLFAYTGTATVYAAAGGAASTLAVDASETYLEWAGRNMGLNGFDGGEHAYLCTDCVTWLHSEEARRAGPFDLIFLDPPTFSNSKDRQGVLEIRRDHPRLISDALSLLAPRGELFFSTNYRKFKMNAEELPAEMIGEIEDITPATIPFDFAGNRKIHACLRFVRA